MKILTYPHPVLIEVSEPVTEFDKNLKQFCYRLHDTMIESGGIGLSAVQVGILRRIVVIQVPGGIPYSLINPVIKHVTEEDPFKYSEGCLSVPGYFEERERPDEIFLEWQTWEGNTCRQHFTGLEAFCIQHELDHLEGKLFIDDLSPLKKSRIRKKIEKTLRRK